MHRDTDTGFPLKIGKRGTVGHKMMLRGGTVRDRVRAMGSPASLVHELKREQSAGSLTIANGYVA